MPENSMKIHCLRLTNTQDLKSEIEKLVKSKKLSSGVILSGVGSLKAAELRLANQNHFYKEERFFEIVSLTGTLSQEGVHLHISLADDTGRVIGGHLVHGCLIHTTCELVIGELTGIEFHRKEDPATGFKEIFYLEKS